MAFCPIIDPAPLFAYLCHHYHSDLLSTLIILSQFGKQSHYETRTDPHFSCCSKLI